MVRSRIARVLTGFVGTVALLGAPMLFAATPESGTHTGEMHHSQSAQSLPDLKELIGKVENRYGGKVVGIEREHKNGLYEVELLGGDGHEQEFYVNSAGEKVTKHHHGKHKSDKHHHGEQ